MNKYDFYFLRLYRSRGNRYLRIGRNCAIELRCPASLSRSIEKYNMLYLVGDESLSKFVVVALDKIPNTESLTVKQVFGVHGKVSDIIKFRMRMDMHKLLFSDCKASLLPSGVINAVIHYHEMVNGIFS